jgi:hypothetical protein
MFEIREPITTRDYNLAIPDDSERHTRYLLRHHLGANVFVDFVRDAILRDAGEGKQKNERE